MVKNSIEWIRTTVTLVVLAAMLVLFSVAKSDSVGVVYPEVSPPYSEAFKQIIDEVTRELGDSPLKLEIEKIEEETVNQWVVKHKLQGPIVYLGRTAKLAGTLPGHITISGGVNTYSGQLPGIVVSLTVAPKFYLETLKELLPRTATLTFVHTDHQKKYAQQLKAESSLYGIEVTTVSVVSPQSVTEAIEQILKDARSGKDAIWISSKALALNQESSLSQLLRKGWKKKLAIISDQPSYVRRGLLFSPLNDYREHGRRIAQTINDLEQNHSSKQNYAFTDAPHTAINRRTAIHLGVNALHKRFASAKAIFPSSHP